MRTAIGKPAWKEGFVFLGNELVLDFLNTRPVQNEQPAELLADSSALLRWVRAANLFSPKEFKRFQIRWRNTARLEKITQSARELRENLRASVLAWEGGGAIKRSTMREINRLLAKYPMRRRLIGQGSALSTEEWFEPREPEDLFAPLAQSALKLFGEVDRTRVRKCQQCVLHFHDTSKKGTRRWCSMQLCGNRSKVAAYAARRSRRAEAKSESLARKKTG